MKHPIRRALAACIAAVFATILTFAASAFDLPTPEDTRRSLGSLEAEPFAVRRLLEPDADFPRLEQPGPGDWLDQHGETDQPFYDFVSSDARPVTAQRKTIVLQPLGEFHPDSSPPLAALQDYAAAYFQLDVVLLPAALLEDRSFEPRINPQTQKVQLLTVPILAALRQGMPADAHCVIAVTMTDLYPAASWNFVYGQASPETRTGVFSFARNDPGFLGLERPDDVDALILRRSCKTLVHEIGHLFGLGHCLHFRCAENGVNHQAESDSRPQHLCPLCLRKLQFATHLELERRYRDLAYFYSQHGWSDEEAWVRRQLEKLRVPEPARPGGFPIFDFPRTSPPAPASPPAVPVPVVPTPDVPAAPPDGPDTSSPIDAPVQLVAQHARSRA